LSSITIPNQGQMCLACTNCMFKITTYSPERFPSQSQLYNQWQLLTVKSTSNKISYIWKLSSFDPSLITSSSISYLNLVCFLHSYHCWKPYVDMFLFIYVCHISYTICQSIIWASCAISLFKKRKTNTIWVIQLKQKNNKYNIQSIWESTHIQKLSLTTTLYSFIHRITLSWDTIYLLFP